MKRKHDITLAEVREATVYCQVERSRLIQSDDADDRLLIIGRTALDRPLKVSLYADRREPTKWWLGTAVPATSKQKFT